MNFRDLRDYNDSFFRSPPLPEIKSYVRILHASPGAPGVDIYANNQPIAKNLTYKKFTPYITLSPGDYNIKVYPTNNTENLLVETTLSVAPNTIYTVAAINKPDNLQLLPILEPHQSLSPNLAFVRFSHLSPDAPNVDVTSPSGRKLFKDVEYKETTGYIPLFPGNYTMELRPTNTSNVVLTVPNIILKPNKFYTVYAVGLAEGNPPLEVLIPLDGNTYLRV